jgi:hypothetical protein
MVDVTLDGSEAVKDGRLRAPIVCFIATNIRSDPFRIKFVVGNFACGDTILRGELSLELESPPEIPRQRLGEIIRFSWPIHGTTLETFDGPDLAALLAAEHYSAEDLFINHQCRSRKSTVWLTAKPEVFAPFTSLPVWPEITAEDPDFLKFGEFVPKRTFIFRFGSNLLLWQYIAHSQIGLPISR